ncbi:MAG: ribonuclease HII [Succinivibrionaceae bacterium]|nr:ribonuclease HII [Succinivibrionaceae bacterium]
MDPFSHYVAGVDEVGRGPLVGNVVTAAVILDPARPIEGLNDSKKLSEKKREALSSVILENALAWAIGEASPEEIDRYNILQATMLAMTRAVDALKTTPEFVLVDGNRLPKWNYASEAVVKGDARVPEISAASIIAKVYRDRQMVELDRMFPQYGFAKHKGYPTAEHLEAIRRYGVNEYYRKSYKPVAMIISEQKD